MNPLPAAPAVPPAAPRRTLAFATLLLLPFILLVVLPIAVLGALAVRSVQGAADDLGAQVLNAAVKRADEAIADHLERADGILDALTVRPAAGTAPARDLPAFASLATFESTAWHLSGVSVQTAQLYFATADGAYLQVRRMDDGSTRIMESNLAAPALAVFRAERPGERSFIQSIARADTDPRETPWYRLAVAAGDRIWTPVYPSLGRDHLLMTRAEPVRGASGILRGVVGADLELERVSQTLGDLHISPGAVAFVIDASGLVVATSTREPLFNQRAGDFTRLAPADSGNALVREAARTAMSAAPAVQGATTAPRRAGPRTVFITGPDGDTRVSVHPLVTARNLDWTLVVAVPRADFIGDINKSAQALGAFGGATLALFLLVWLLLARRILRDLGSLKDLAVRIGRDEAPVPARASRIGEFAALSGALHEMAARLTDSRRHIADQNRQLAGANAELEGRVAARTREIDSARHFYVSVLDNCPMLVAVRDLEGRLVFANHAWERLYKVRREDAIGKTRTEIGQFVAGVADVADRDALATPGRIVENEIASDEGRIYLFSRSALIDAAGRPTGVIVAASDITALRHAEDGVTRERERLALTIEASRAAIGEWDFETGRVWWSPRLKELLGYPVDHIVAATADVATFAHPEDQAAFRDAITGMLRRHQRMDLELRLAHSDGEYLWVHAVGLAVHDGDGRVRRAVGSFTDISLRKAQELKLDDQRKFADDLVRLNPHPIFVKDIELRFTSVNAAWERLTGLSEAGVVGRTVRMIFPDSPLIAEQDAQDHTLIEAGGSRSIETVVLRPDGERRDVIMSKSALTRTDGTVFGIIGALTDITELKATREAALSAAQAKAVFLATMSHEIRTPMNGVIGMTGLLAETALSPMQRDYVDTIRVSGEQLLAIINDILDFSKIESGKMELESEPLSLARMIEESIEMVADRAREKRVELLYTIDPEVPAAIHGDITRLRQVVVNLAANAVKFTSEGEVLVSAHLRRAESADAPADIEFRVRDSGIGIPPERIGALFSAFTQVDASTTRQYGGTGLGLAICKRLVEMMGGSIGVESAVGQGSTFWFTIHAHAAPAITARTVGIDPTRIAGRSVLLVDDNPTNLLVLSRQLEQWGLQSETAASGSAALARLRAGPGFDLAILDMQMPRMDGLMLAAEIRATPAGRALPLIMLSSVVLPADADPGRLLGARLMKPVRQLQLFDAIADLLALTPAGGTGLAGRGAPAVNPAAAIERLADALPLRILVADDNAVNRKVATLMIARLGYAIDTADDGKEAVEMVARAAAGDAPYDLVFMDVQMPELDGFEATRTIVAGHGDARPRIVAMTANAMQGDRDACLAAGMDDYLTKPLAFGAIEAALRRWGRSREAPATGDTAAAASPGTAAAPATAPAIDWGRLEEFREYDDPQGSLVKDIINLYLRDGEPRVIEIARAFGDEDADAMTRAAHALKGASGNLGADQVAALCKTIESAGHAAQPARAAEAVAALPAAFARAREALLAGPTPAAQAC